MYLNTPCRNYGEVRNAIEARSLVVRVVKNRSGELCGQVENGRVGIAVGFALQMILPAACAVACAVFTKSWAALFAVAVYGLLPFVLPLNGFVSAAMTLAGLFGLAGGLESGPCGASFAGRLLQRGEIGLVVFHPAGIDKGYYGGPGPV